MSGADVRAAVDEFDFIREVLRPLTRGAPEALDLADDAALVGIPAGEELVVSADAMVEGVHFLPDDPPELIARKLLRANLSDLAAKAAEPFGYFLVACWPSSWDRERRTRFAGALAEDQELYGVSLLGGDTTSTPGPLTLSITILGRTPAGAMVRRNGARVGDRVLVSGPIGDAALGLEAARGGLPDLSSDDRAWLIDRYRLPRPRLDLRPMLRTLASAAADVSDGLVADAGHIGEASGVGVTIALDRLPLSPPAGRWLASVDRRDGLARLATGGDDYEVVFTAPPSAVAPALAAGATEVGRVVEGAGMRVTFAGEDIVLDRTGWRHG